jgi:hypothetical protein
VPQINCKNFSKYIFSFPRNKKVCRTEVTDCTVTVFFHRSVVFEKLHKCEIGIKNVCVDFSNADIFLKLNCVIVYARVSEAEFH